MFNTMKLVTKRILAFLIDYTLIILYTLVLAGISMLIHKITSAEPGVLNPLSGQVVGFFTLTLPVFLYFYLTEHGSMSATIGKNKMGLIVKAYQSKFSNQVFIRNVFKFIPWEMAHTGVHWIVYYSLQEVNPPSWVLVILTMPQLIVIAYIISIVASNGKSSIYDKWAGTRVEKK